MALVAAVVLTMAAAIVGTGPLLDRLRGTGDDGDLALDDIRISEIPNDAGVKSEHHRQVVRQRTRSPAPAGDSRANQIRGPSKAIAGGRRRPRDDGLDRNETRWSCAAAASLEPLLPWLVGAWGVGVLGLSLRLLGGWLWIQWLVRHETRPVAERWAESLARLQGRLRIARPVRLLESIRLQVPLAVGWLRPVILLPVTALTGLPSDQLEAILAHELAHIRRYDYLVNLVQSVVETLLFYHPAAWWISARIRAEREHCCDDWAVEVCGDRLIYARALAALEEQRSAGWLLAPSARDGSLLDRVRRLLGVDSSVESAGRWTGRHAGAGDGRAARRGASCSPPRPTRPGLALRPRDAITGIGGHGRRQAGGRGRRLARGPLLQETRRSRWARPGRIARVASAWLRSKSGSSFPNSAGDRSRLISRACDRRIDQSDDTIGSSDFRSGVPVRLTLEAPVSTTFSVVDAAGKPVAGVAVAVSHSTEDPDGICPTSSSTASRLEPVRTGGWS